jgi:hypothetical protein
MNGVQFDETDANLEVRSPDVPRAKPKSMQALLIRLGIVKTEQQANLVLLLIAAVALAAAIYVFVVRIYTIDSGKAERFEQYKHVDQSSIK